MNRNYALFAFVLGLIACLWVALGYLDGSLLALAVTLVITTVYLVGALEMRRFQRNTESLAAALANIPDDLGHLGEWLQQVPGALRNTVRQRIEGERVALPGPHITPYLVGLLVLLGMLGTFLGMVVTLNGAVLALESTTDLQTIRAALAAPVKGLGVAFVTSVAGVATSAMLGLISALCRRDRLKVGQQLDSRIAGVLRDFSLTHQRQETFKALQAQAQSLPDLVGKLDTMMQQMADQQRQLSEQLLAGQARFYGETSTLYTQLAQSVDQSLKTTLKDSASVAANTIQPVVTATMQQIADESRKLNETLSGSLQGQLEGLTGQFTQTVSAVSSHWTDALHRHEHASEAQRALLADTLDRYTETFTQRSNTLLDAIETRQARLHSEAAERQQALTTATRQQQQTLVDTLAARFDDLSTRLDSSVSRIAGSFDEKTQILLSTVADTHAAVTRTAETQHAHLAGTVTAQIDTITRRLDRAVSAVAETWQQALATHQAEGSALNAALNSTLNGFADTFGSRSQALLDSVAEAHAALKAELALQHARQTEQGDAQQRAIAGQVASQLDGIAQRFDVAVNTVAETWQAALSKHEQASERLTQALDQTQTALADTFAQRTAALLADLRATQADWQRDWASGEQARQDQFTAALTAMAGKLETQWQGHGDAALAQQQALTETLSNTARDLVAATQQQAETTIAEVTRLMQTAAEAPKAAAEVIGQLRQELSASMARDNSLLEERSRIMATLSTLLDAINHASTEQRGAIDALVASSADLLARIGDNFASKVEGETGKLIEVSAGVVGGALEVASLGEAFGTAVNLFAESSEKMMGALQRIEGALAKSLTRSDEQLAYYVAQAREIIDLSILSQKKMVDDLQRVAGTVNEA